MLLIDAEELKKELWRRFKKLNDSGLYSVANEDMITIWTINEMPTHEARSNGRWEELDINYENDDDVLYECNCCCGLQHSNTLYCSGCGAKMENGENMPYE